MDRYSKFDEFVNNDNRINDVVDGLNVNRLDRTPSEVGICKIVHDTQVELENLYGQVIEIVGTIDNTRNIRDLEPIDICSLGTAVGYNLSLVRLIADEVDFILGKL